MGWEIGILNVNLDKASVTPNMGDDDDFFDRL